MSINFLSCLGMFWCCSVVLYGENQTTNPFVPQNIIVIQREGYIVAYDGRTRTALWVYEQLTSESFKTKSVDRHSLRFRPDDQIPVAIRAALEDYRGSGFDLGHLCPFADCQSKKSAATETFLLSNICPQNSQFNRGLWNQLEMKLRKMASHYKVLHIITIPLYLPLDGYVRYQVLGNNNVGVPTHLSKVIFAEKQNEIEGMAYVLPNAVIPLEVPLDSFKTSIEKVERLSGLIFTQNQRYLK